MQLSPAEHVIRAFGGVRATARALNKTPSSVSKWLKKQYIPSKNIALIIEKAEELQLDITAEDLVVGREVGMSDY